MGNALTDIINQPGGGTQQDFLTFGQGREGIGSGGDPLAQAGKVGKGLASKLKKFGGPALNLGLSNLLGILSRQGETDPRRFNRQLVGIGRDTEALQQAFTTNQAARGPMNSRALDAINASLGSAGADRLAGARANEAALAEQRQRDDLGLLLQLIIGPQMGFAQGAIGHQSAEQLQQDAQRNQLTNTIIGGILGAGGAAAGGAASAGAFGGGGGG